MAKKMKKKTKLKIIPILIFLIILTGIYFGGSYLLEMKIKNIFIKGNSILKDQEIIELAKIDNYPSFFKTSSSKIEKRIKQNLYIKKVKVTKAFLSTINIEIEEYVPLFIKDNKVVVGKNVDIDISYEKIVGTPLLINYVPNTVYDKFIASMLLVNENIRAEISEIEYQPNDYDKSRFLLYMNDGNKVYLTITKFELINKYDEIYPSLGGKKGILYLDSGNHFEILE